MTINRAVNIFTGTLIMSSLILGHVTNQIDLADFSWLWLTALVGFGLFQMGFTGFCPAAIIFKLVGLKDTMTGSKNKEKNTSCC